MMPGGRRGIEPELPRPFTGRRDFVRVAASEGVREVITRRDAPFGDYSQAPADQQPRKRSELT